MAAGEDSFASVGEDPPPFEPVRIQLSAAAAITATMAALIERSARFMLPEESVGLSQSTTPPRSGPGSRSSRSRRLPTAPPSSRPRATAPGVETTRVAATMSAAVARIAKSEIRTVWPWKLFRGRRSCGRARGEKRRRARRPVPGRRGSGRQAPWWRHRGRRSGRRGPEPVGPWSCPAEDRRPLPPVEGSWTPRGTGFVQGSNTIFPWVCLSPRARKASRTRSSG